MKLYATRINTPARFKPTYRITGAGGMLYGLYTADGAPTNAREVVLPVADVKLAIANAPK